MKSNGAAPEPIEETADGKSKTEPEDLEQEIRRRAHGIYEERGFVDGFEMDDWLQAEAELRPKAA